MHVLFKTSFFYKLSQGIIRMVILPFIVDVSLIYCLLVPIFSYFDVASDFQRVHTLLFVNRLKQIKSLK